MAAATVAWLLAVAVTGLDRAPYFAPISAVVGLNSALGNRGRNALRLLAGVFVGITVGELTLLLVGGGIWQLSVAMFIAMCIAATLGNARVMIAQAAIGVVLTVSLSDQGAGLDRIVDALIGTTVALVFSQVLFPPQPLKLLDEAQSALFAILARGLSRIGEALQKNDPDMVSDGVDTIRSARDELGEVDEARDASARVMRHSFTWRRHREALEHVRATVQYHEPIVLACESVATQAASMARSDRTEAAPLLQQTASVFEELRQDAERDYPGLMKQVQKISAQLDRRPDEERTPFTQAMEDLLTHVRGFIGESEQAQR